MEVHAQGVSAHKFGAQVGGAKNGGAQKDGAQNGGAQSGGAGGWDNGEGDVGAPRADKPGEQDLQYGLLGFHGRSKLRNSVKCRTEMKNVNVLKWKGEQRKKEGKRRKG